MEDVDAPIAAGAVDMNFALARAFAHLMVQLVKNGTLTEAGIAEILVEEERIICALLEEGEFQSVLALATAHETMRSALEPKIELQPHVERLRRHLNKPADLMTPREMLALDKDQWLRLMQKHRNRKPA